MGQERKSKNQRKLRIERTKKHRGNKIQSTYTHIHISPLTKLYREISPQQHKQIQATCCSMDGNAKPV